LATQEVEISLEGKNRGSLGRIIIVGEQKANLPENIQSLTVKSILRSRNVGFEPSGRSLLQPPIMIRRIPETPLGWGLVLQEESEYQIRIMRELPIRGSPIREQDFVTLRSSGTQADYLLRKSRLPQSGGVDEYSLNFRSYVGESVIDFVIDDVPTIGIPIEVRSKKLGYKNDYVRILSDISEFSSSLLLDPNSPLFLRADFEERNRCSPYEDYLFLEYVMKEDNLSSCISRISRRPHTRIVQSLETTPIAIASSPVMECIPDAAFHPGNDRTSSETLILLFANIQNRVSEETTDTPENQLVKFFLNQMLGVARSLQDDWCMNRGRSLKWRVDEIEQELESFLSEDIFNGVSQLTHYPNNSQVLQRREGYRRINEMLRMIDFSIHFEWEDVKDVVNAHNLRLSQAYEIWCFVVLLKILTRLSGKEIRPEDIFQTEENSRNIRLRRGENSRTKFLFNIEGRSVSVKLMYNATFTRDGKYPSYSLNHRPDFSMIVANAEGTSGEYLLIHFDAKYRADIDKWRGPEEDTASDCEPEKSAWASDINKMHTYKDAILRTRGAYTLFPGNQEQFYFEDIVDGGDNSPIPSVGAICLNPANGVEEGALGRWILRLIRKMATEIAEPATGFLKT